MAVTVTVTVSVVEPEPPEGTVGALVTAGAGTELVSTGDTPLPGVAVGVTVTGIVVPEMTVEVT